ncbi:hypothetical protein ACJMK2_013008 [Sinanodonta woodiana]|uniref:G-protein coupled receptors family 1 profile domain-containing protein n=1 Tax=Sinanodonta woodiana TaxID=1069815 RepID=A0ABD3VA09_SINWO
MDVNMSAVELERLENEQVIQNVGGIILVSFLMCVGFGGNSVAIFVYLRRFKPSTYRTFIVSLAIVDLLTCCVAMPFSLVILIYPITFHDNLGCKLFRFVSYVMNIGSSIILLTIAAERYRKICVPLGRQMSNRMSKFICVVDIMLGVLLSWPVAVMYGSKTFKTNNGRIVGTECSVNNYYADTKYPAYFNIFLIFIFVAALLILSIVYILIGKEIFLTKKRTSKTNQTLILKSDPLSRSQTDEVSCSQPYQKDDKSRRGLVENISDYKSENLEISLGENGQGTNSTESKSKCCELNEENKTTKDCTTKQLRNLVITRVLFIITVVFVCSYVPHLALLTAAFLNKNLLSNLSFAGTVTYQIFRWTFFINNVANPIIYGFYDSKFVREVRILRRSFLAHILKYNLRRNGNAS